MKQEATSRKAPLRAVERLLAYAIIECQELALPEIEELLTAAAQAVSENCGSGLMPPVRAPRGRPKMRLVTIDGARTKKETAGNR
jgi:hypothetical protein